MAMKRLLCALLLASLAGGCGISDFLHETSREGKIIPALRYVAYRDDQHVYEDISEGHPELADEIRNTAVAHGPMKVDCQRIREIGIIVYRDNSWWHDFDFVAAWPDTIETEPKHFTYEDRWTHGYLKGATRFREPLSDSIVTLSVMHRGEKIYSTAFEVLDCPTSALPDGNTAS